VENEFATCQVLPRGQRFFELAEFHDAEPIPEMIFYTLLIEGDITNGYIERYRPTVENIPRRVRREVAAAAAEDAEMLCMVKRLTSRRLFHLWEVYQMLLRTRRYKRADRIQRAGFISLFRHFRQHGYDTGRRSPLDLHASERSEAGRSGDDLCQRIEAVLLHAPSPMTKRDIAKQVGVTAEEVNPHLYSMLKANRVRQVPNFAGKAPGWLNFAST
jgi:hypothetical protein